MDDLIEDSWDGSAPGNTPEYTVAEISGAVRKTLEGAFGRVRVRGEVGRVFVARSGHLYFDIKDERNVLASVCWKGQVGRLHQRPEEGMEVVATGRLTTFGGQSKYQLTVDQVEAAGEGALMAMLEKRKRALAAEGLFDESRKRPLPRLPRVIGVVTSPSGAVIRDILHRLSERFPRHVIVWPVAVQGQACASEVARAIEGFNALAPGGLIARPDLLIVARGGGSIEDLWGFNEEIVARAAAASRIPLISAVGHETDTTLIDYVSDCRAPTPTAAAEMAVPVRLDCLSAVSGLEARASGAMARGLDRRRERLRDLSRALPRPAQLLEGPRQRLDYAAMRLPAALRAAVQGRRLTLAQAAAGLRPQGLRARLRGESARLDRLAARLRPDLVARGIAALRREVAEHGRRLDAAASGLLERRAERVAGFGRLLGSLSYKGTLARGYAVVRDAGGHVVTGRDEAGAAGALEIEFADGRLRIGGAAPGPASRSRARPEPPDQGSLF
ncbi:MAG: exodeoxyribonuclease VII large subunit [Paracoccaceae bacterium]|jgi:exodeoxyribonuclease VII large subunit|nr:exodeoxyribonuclease VII large subunit [Paracoccaceae bacterium]